jgi:hypothetical protein
MRSVFVVVANVFREQAFQMALIHRDGVIQQIAPAALNPSLCDSVLPGTLERSPNTPNSHRPNRSWNFRPILGVAVEYEKPRTCVERKRFPQLLNDPRARRMTCDVDVQDVSTVMANDEEAIQHAERNRRHREEVHRCDGLAMVAQKSEPAFRWLRVSRTALHPAGDCSLGNIETEHEKLSMDARRSPARILGDHSENQVTNLFRNAFPPTRSAHHRDSTPIERKASPMPPNHSLWADNDKGLLPTRPKPACQNPEELIEHVQPGARMFALENNELLPENQIFE